MYNSAYINVNLFKKIENERSLCYNVRRGSELSEVSCQGDGSPDNFEDKKLSGEPSL